MTKVGPILSSPVSESRSVYVCTITGRVYRIDKERNVIKWHVNTSNPVVSSPSIYRNHLIVGTFSTWIHEAAGGSEHSSISAYSIDDATEKWKYEVQNGVFSSICSIEDIHIFGCLDGKVYALSNEGNLKWQFWTGGEVWSSPSSDGHTISVGSDDGRLYALDLDGKMVWKTNLAGKVRSSSPCVSINAEDLGLPSIYIGTQSVRSSTGSVIWRFKTDDKVWSSPLLTRDIKVFVGSLDSHIYHIDIVTGRLIWKFPTMSMIDSSPSLSGGTLLVGSRDGYLYFFDQGNTNSFID